MTRETDARKVGMLAFFPWVYIREKVAIGSSLRLFPYQHRRCPGDLEHISQSDIDGILAGYADRPRSRVKQATILEVDNWKSGQLDLEIMSRLFRARSAIGFAAIASRRTFNSNFHYDCFDSYALVAQKYIVGAPGMFSFFTRRRDGEVNHMWHSKEFAFQRPLHVDTRAEARFDGELAAALFDLPEADSESLFEAIDEFNAANTDGAIPEHIEVVMTKSAFEWLLQIGESARDFVAAIKASLDGINLETEKSGPLTTKWSERWQHANRPLDAWASEFCALRGSAAHGKDRVRAKWVWRPRTHLAFAAKLFPLLVRKRLHDLGRCAFKDVELEKLRRIEWYLTDDPFVPTSRNPWTVVDQYAFVAAKARIMYGGSRKSKNKIS